MKDGLIKAKVYNYIKAMILPLIVYILFFILTRLINETTAFGWPSHMKIVLQQLVPTLMIGFGISFNLLAGRWDFSYGGVIALAAIIGGQIANRFSMNAFGMMLVCIGVGVIIEFIVSLIYVSFRVPCIVVSLGVVQILEMLTNMLFGGEGATIRGNLTKFGMIPYIFVVAGIAIAVYYLMMMHTKIGYDIRAIGNGQEIARNIGTHVKSGAVINYMICGAFMGLAGCLNISVAGTQRALMNLDSTGLMFDAMMCVIIGTYLEKYCNIVFAVFMGTLTMKLLGSGLLGIGASSQAQSIAKGIFLLLFIAFSTNQYRLEQRKERSRQAERANRKFQETLGLNQ